MAITSRLKRNFYKDSVAAMRIAQTVSAAAGLARVSLLMGTPANKDMLAQAGLLAPGCPQQFLNVCFDDPEADIPVELLTPLIQDEAWTAFDAHLVGVLVVVSQSGKCGPIVNAFFNRAYIHAESFGQVALNVPTGDVAAISEKCTTEGPHHLIEDRLR